MSITLMSHTYGKKLGSATRKGMYLKACDHASDDGSGVYPSVAHFAACCEISTRTVKRILKEFVDEGLLKVVKKGGQGGRGTTHYSLDIDALNNLESLFDGGDTLSPPGVTPCPEGVTPCPVRGDTVSPKPSKNYQITRARARAKERAAPKESTYLIVSGSPEWEAWQPYLTDWEKSYIERKGVVEWTVPTQWPSGHENKKNEAA